MGGVVGSELSRSTNQREGKMGGGCCWVRDLLLGVWSVVCCACCGAFLFLSLPSGGDRKWCCLRMGQTMPFLPLSHASYPDFFNKSFFSLYLISAFSTFINKTKLKYIYIYTFTIKFFFFYSFNLWCIIMILTMMMIINYNFY